MLFIATVHSFGRNGVKRADEGETADGDRRIFFFLSDDDHGERHTSSITSLQAKLQRQFPLSEADRAVTSPLRVHDALHMMHCCVWTLTCKHWLLWKSPKKTSWVMRSRTDEEDNSEGLMRKQRRCKENLTFPGIFNYADDAS